MIFLVNKITQIEHINTESYFQSGIREFTILCYRAVFYIILLSVHLKGKRNLIIFLHKQNSFQRTVNADEFIKQMPKSLLSETSLQGKKNQSLVLVFKKQIKCYWRLHFKCTAINGETSFEEWFSVVASNRRALWADYNRNPRTDTYLSSSTWVFSALEYSNDCFWALKYAYGALRHF